MKLQLNTLLGCLLIGCTVAQARVGETEKQCDERYGKPTAVREDESQRTYHKGNFIVVAHFYEGKCDCLTFRKDTADFLGTPIFDKERDALLKANGGDKEWVKSDGPGMTYLYKTNDEKVFAYHSGMPGGELMIITPEADKRRLEAKKAEEEKKMKGF